MSIAVGMRVRHTIGTGVVVAECDEHPYKTFKVKFDGGLGGSNCVMAELLTPIDDPVARPSHYVVGGYECRKVIQALGLSWAVGNAFAYLWRAGRKTADRTEDLRKAIECLKFELEQLEERP